MTTIVVKFPKLGVQQSTWVDDDWWASLPRSQQEAAIRRFVKNHYPHELSMSKRMKSRFMVNEDYTWNIL